LKEKLVKDLMVPLPEYATISQDATLHEAISALENAQKHFDPKRYRHRAVLVFDENRKVVGKLSMFDILRSLEPTYKDIGDLNYISRAGLSPQVLQIIQDQYSLWDKPLERLGDMARNIKVKDIMYTPSKGEYVAEDASLAEAIHLLVVGHHHSLLVSQGDEIVGILRLTDVFNNICEMAKLCE
jgi:CBS domain-containing protein